MWRFIGTVRWRLLGDSGSCELRRRFVCCRMRSLAMRQHNYDLGGKCAYCLTDFNADDLTDEHIIPRALNGGLILKKGACRRCAAKSSKDYEGAALNNDLLIPRRLLELRTGRNRGAKQY
jgi:5-methylcytosine-specific restriction endonuclease McrA